MNFGVILGWSVVTMTVLHWLFNLLAGPSVRVLPVCHPVWVLCSHPTATGTGFLPLQLAAGLLPAAGGALLGSSHRAARQERGAVAAGRIGNRMVYLLSLQASHRHRARTGGAAPLLLCSKRAALTRRFVRRDKGL